MKKKAALLAILLVLSVSGCGGNTAPESTSAATESAIVTSVDENGNVSAVMEAPEKEDTTEQALEYIAEKSPVFKKYLDMRRNIPISFESTILQDGEGWLSGFYIKDAAHAALYTIDPSGARIDIVYDTDKVYQIEHARKTVFTYECGEDFVKKGIEQSSLAKIYYDEAMESSYYNDQYDYEGTVYDRVIISTGDDQVFHYFDTETGKLVYTVSGTTVTHVDLMENSITNEDIFNIPTDYEQKKYSDLVEEQLEAEKAAAEQAAAAGEN